MKKTHSSSFHKGFTLIELLVVVAIIALLAATILASLGAARTKARDARTTSELSSMRAQAELYANNHGFNYATSSSGGDCTSADLIANTTDTSSLNNLYKDVSANTTDVFCKVATNQWVVAAKLQGGSYFCVDSNGAAKSYTTASNPSVTSSTTATNGGQCL